MRVIMIEVRKFYEYIYNKLFPIIKKYNISFVVDYKITQEKKIKIFGDIYIPKETDKNIDKDINKFFDSVILELEEKLNSVLNKIKKYKIHTTKKFIFIYYDKYLSKLYSKEII